ADGSLATKHWFIKKLKSLLPRKNIAGHSFRAGSTTELVVRGVELALVQKIGRWSSDAFHKYIRAHPATNLFWKTTESCHSASIHVYSRPAYAGGKPPANLKHQSQAATA
ncbi:12642_t:CDS:2, partial [Ambispora leptoticha]